VGEEERGVRVSVKIGQNVPLEPRSLGRSFCIDSPCEKTQDGGC